ncbi:DUF433 domain-containing protein [Nakamurella multipartita]
MSEYDELTADDVRAALEYAASVVGGAQVIPLRRNHRASTPGGRPS